MGTLPFVVAHRSINTADTVTALSAVFIVAHWRKVVRFEVVYETPDGLLKTNWHEDGQDYPSTSEGRVLQRS